jgi:uncharacterized repeat protein (TIGR03806 family)
MRRAQIVTLLFLLTACDLDTSIGLDRRPSNPTCRAHAELPERLEDTGCFEPGSSAPIGALLAYGVQVPLWSDGASKERFVALPDGAVLSIDEHGRLVLPPGGVLVKTFRLGDQPIETRLLVRADDGSWHAATYVWDEAGRAARRFDGGRIERGGQTWDVPTRSECFDCHVEAAGVSLGLELAQLDAPFTYGATGRTANQIDTLQGIGALANVDDDARTGAYQPEDPRAYLHVNCAHCHRSGGQGAGTLDLRNGIDERWMHVVDVPAERGDPTGEGGVLVAPGAPERSVLFWRMQTDDPLWRMPPLGTLSPDPVGLARIEEWIEATEIPIE